MANPLANKILWAIKLYSLGPCREAGCSVLNSSSENLNNSCFLPFVFFHKIISKMIKELIVVASFALKWQTQTRYGNIETSFGINTHQDAFAFEKFFWRIFCDSAALLALATLVDTTQFIELAQEPEIESKWDPKPKQWPLLMLMLLNFFPICHWCSR
jgi:hypothetical protein